MLIPTIMDWNVIVIGGGHAGVEAAHASARLGCRTLLLTLDLSKIGVMSCNPAIGGLAKGQLVKEIDALGGLMGVNTDQSTIQFRKLNASKGPAVRSSRAQCDKHVYAETMRGSLKTVENLNFYEGEVERVLLDRGSVKGVKLRSGEVLSSSAVVITSGTFMCAVMHTGELKQKGGRVGEKASFGLSQCLRELGFRLNRLKTGTPPRLHKKSIDFHKLERQPGDQHPRPFSFFRTPRDFPVLPQVDCHITYTNSLTHEIIQESLSLSPMYTGAITGVGPRYCPSIEDKISRFRDKNRHQIFLEPEGLGVNEVYVNGVSTSLPREVQEKFIRSVIGLERAEFIRYGYAVEYDSIDARQLRRTLESKDVPGLFLAGQVNGTSGYEEAAAQGLVAGINAALFCQEREPFELSRFESYTGVMIDDLTTKGTDEPYRMFTSRAEYRLLLREDNADLRLSEKGWDLGLLDGKSYEKFQNRKARIGKWRKVLKETYITPKAEVNNWFQKKGLFPLKDRISIENLLKRPEFDWASFKALGLTLEEEAADIIEQVEIQVKYEGYIKRDLQLLEGVRKNDQKKIPMDIDYGEVAGLSNEIRGRLRGVRPETLGQASRIMGVTPAAIANLLIHIKIKERSRENEKRYGRGVREFNC